MGSNSSDSKEEFMILVIVSMIVLRDNYTSALYSVYVYSPPLLEVHRFIYIIYIVMR